MNPKWIHQKANRGTRTPDPRITNALLYQLSQIGISVAKVIFFYDIKIFSA